jgi:hypothetical protein
MAVFPTVLRNADKVDTVQERDGFPARPRSISHTPGPAMTNAPPEAAQPASSAKVSRFIVYVAVVLTLAMVLFPPFTSMYGTEYAFVLRGPEWWNVVSDSGADLGLTARIYWAGLGVQLGLVWAIALGASWFLRPVPRP